MSDDRERIFLGQKYSAVLATITDDSLAAMAARLEGEMSTAFCRTVGIPAEAIADAATLGPAIREGIARRRAHHDAGVLLAEPCTTYCIEKLGDAAEDPTLEQLNEVLPEAIEAHGLDAARLMAVQYVRSLKGFRQLVASDERFAIPEPAPVAALRDVDEAAQAAKRAARKERKAAAKARPRR